MVTRAAVQERRRLYRDGIALALDREPDLRVLGVATGADELVELCQRRRPDVIVTEADVTEWDALRLATSLQCLCGPVRLVGLYRSFSEDQASEALQAGFSVFVSALAGLPALRAAVRGDRRGDPGDLRGDRRSGLLAPPADLSELYPPAHDRKLTARQLDVLRLVGQGSTTEEVGRRLGISPKTVAHHKQCVFRKLGVQNQAHAVSVAMRTGLLAASQIQPRWEAF